MSGFKQKVLWNTIKQKKKKNNPQYEETEQATESDLDMAGMLELSDQKFKITMINMLRTLMENGQHSRTQAYRDEHISKEMETKKESKRSPRNQKL